jgi:acyl carrier protein
MESKIDVYEAVISAINDIKRTGFTVDAVEPDFYLGGDLGIDSKEMLEVWYELEQRFGIQIGDAEKRERYLLRDVAEVLQAHLGDRAVAA